VAEYACEYTITDLVCELCATIDTLPTKGDLFNELFSFLRNSTENSVDICEFVFFNESVVCPMQKYVAVL
jgi:hypothetical protein